MYTDPIQNNRVRHSKRITQSVWSHVFCTGHVYFQNIHLSSKILIKQQYYDVKCILQNKYFQEMDTMTIDATLALGKEIHPPKGDNFFC